MTEATQYPLQRRGRCHRGAAGGSVVLLALLLASCGANAARTTTPTPTATVSSSRRVWIMTLTVLKAMAAVPAARAALAGSTVYATNSLGQLPPALPGVDVVPTMGFTSEATFAADAAAGKIPSKVHAILYDNEGWSFTPDNEKGASTVGYYKEAAALAHQHGWLLIATPGSSALCPKIAPYVNVIDIQAQEKQASVASYTDDVAPIARAVRAANPSVVIVSGLSTNPSRGTPTPAQLVALARATFTTLVQGWWLNIPPPGARRTSAARYDIGSAFLSQLGPAHLS